MDMSALDAQGLSLTAGAFQLGPIDLSLANSEYLVLMGATGSGKSLLVKAICGLITPSTGTIQIAERDVTALPPRARSIGYVPQSSALFPHLPVVRNLTFPGEVAGRPWREVRAGLDDLIDMLTLAPLLDRTPTTLSGGERQKVALGRALAAQPSLLILDEPVSALDEPSRREICRALCKVHDALGIATIHVCHSLAEARLVSSQVGIMDAGRLQCTGPLDELIAHPPDNAAARALLDLDLDSPNERA
jgi:ABC-type sugar transport system ATPase subunit